MLVELALSVVLGTILEDVSGDEEVIALLEVVMATDDEAVDVDLTPDVGVKFTPVYTTWRSSSDAWPAYVVATWVASLEAPQPY